MDAEQRFSAERADLGLVRRFKILHGRNHHRRNNDVPCWKLVPVQAHPRFHERWCVLGLLRIRSGVFRHWTERGGDNVVIRTMVKSIDSVSRRVRSGRGNFMLHGKQLCGRE